MSHAALVQILVLGLPGLIQAIAETGLEFKRQKSFRSDDGKTHSVDLVVSDREGASVGVRVDAKTGEATFIPADCKGGKGKSLAGRIVQRYAYVKATEELRKKGYKIVEERNEADGSIRVVAQRWK